MNERYKELAIEANLGPACESQAIAIKKFAELIVRECIMLQYRRGIEGFGIVEERMIKEHFGVEE